MPQTPDDRAADDPAASPPDAQSPANAPQTSPAEVPRTTLGAAVDAAVGLKEEATGEAWEDPLTDHEYDGIREYDNPTPGWWRLVFAASIVFGFGYMYWVSFGHGDHGIYAEYEADVTEALMAQFAELGELEQNAATLERFVTDPQEQRWLGAGEAIYRANCVACHGTGGIGLSGPNLTDDLYIHIDKSEDILRVLNVGAAGGAMPAWRNRLQPNEIVLVGAYVASLRGQNLAGRTGQGKQIPPFFSTAE